MRKGKLPLALALGCLLMACGLCLFLFFQLRTHLSAQAAGDTAAQIQALLPPQKPGIPGSASNTSMPLLELEGQDYAALVEIPAFGVTLPVGGSWDTGKLSRHPCRFWGSVYDGSLVIGGSDQPGQFDFCDSIHPGAEITVTALNGETFTYTLERIDRSDHAQAEWLMDEEFHLTLFTRAAFSLEYIALRCTGKAS